MEDAMESLCGTIHCEYFKNFDISDVYDETLFSVGRNYLMSNNMQAFPYKCILRHLHLREANHTIVGVSLEAMATDERGWIPTTE